MPKIDSKTKESFTMTILQEDGVIDVQFEKSILALIDNDEPTTAVKYLGLLAVTTVQNFLENDTSTTRVTRQ